MIYIRFAIAVINVGTSLFYCSLVIISVLTIFTISWISAVAIPVIIICLGCDLTDSHYRIAARTSREESCKFGCEALRADRGTSYFPRAPFDVFVAMLYAYTNRCVITSRAQYWFVDYFVFRIFDSVAIFRTALRSSVLESIGMSSCLYRGNWIIRR